MLPFLKPRRAPGIITAVTVKRDGNQGISEEQDGHKDGVIEAAEALIRAIGAKDAEAVAQALQDAHDCCGAEDGDDESADTGEQV